MSQAYLCTGNLGRREIILRFSAKGSPYCFFDVAVKAKGKTANTVWWNCVAYGTVAEDIAMEYKPGDTITVKEGYFTPTVDTRDNKPTVQLQVKKIGEIGRSAREAGNEPPPQGYDFEESPFNDDDVPF